MKSTAEIKLAKEGFLISGDLCFSNVMSIYDQSLVHFNHFAKLEFDLSQVKSSDSSGLALLLEWLKYAKQNSKPIRFNHMPVKMLSLAKAAGLDKILQQTN